MLTIITTAQVGTLTNFTVAAAHVPVQSLGEKVFCSEQQVPEIWAATILFFFCET